MASYKTIKGFAVQTLPTDPVGTGIADATWSSGGDVNGNPATASEEWEVPDFQIKTLTTS